MMLILGILGLVILALVIWMFLKSKPIPKEHEIFMSVSEDQMASEISQELINQYEGVSIDDEDVQKNLENNESLWEAWLESGFVPGDKLTVDFYFYTAHQENAIKLKRKLEQEGFHVDVYPETTLLILKGWKIKTQIRRAWDLETLNQYAKVMAAMSEKEGPYLEGFAAMINKNQTN